MITSIAQLENILSEPAAADRAALDALDGDLLILGVGGKMGPSLATRAKRAAPGKRVIGVSRFSSREAREAIEAAGVETVSADLLEPADLRRLPDAPNIIYMAGRKFGSTGAESLTWAMNAYLPAVICERFPQARIVAFSSGNIYPFVPVTSGGATESTAPSPVGEYAQSVLARERMFEYHAQRHGIPMVLLRLNYAVELRYGVLLDIGTKVFERRRVDLTMGCANVIWQGDANSVCLRAFGLCSKPPAILNLTGPETLSVRWAATRFAEHFGCEPLFEGAEAPNALLNNASRCHQIFGYPTIGVERIIEWTAQWIGMGGATLDKPTHFETRDGRF